MPPEAPAVYEDYFPKALPSSKSLALCGQCYLLQHEVCGISSLPPGNAAPYLSADWFSPQNWPEVIPLCLCLFNYWNIFFFNPEVYLEYLKISSINLNLINKNNNYVDKGRIKKRVTLHFKLY